MITCELQNIVAHGSFIEIEKKSGDGRVVYDESQNRHKLGCHFDMKALAYACGGRFLNVFPSVTIAVVNPRLTINIFEAGQFVVLGAKSWASIVYAVTNIALAIRDRLGKHVQPINVAAINATSLARVGHRLDLPALAWANPGRVSYDPKMYGAARYTARNTDRKVVMSIYDTGSIVIAGGRHNRENEEALQHNIHHILQYKLDTSHADVPVITPPSRVSSSSSASASASGRPTITNTLGHGQTTYRSRKRKKKSVSQTQCTKRRRGRRRRGSTKTTDASDRSTRTRESSHGIHDNTGRPGTSRHSNHGEERGRRVVASDLFGPESEF